MIIYVNIINFNQGEISFIKKNLKLSNGITKRGEYSQKQFNSKQNIPVQNKCEKNESEQIQSYLINYRYHNSINNSLNLYCENVTLNNKRNGINFTKYNEVILPMDMRAENEVNINIINVLKQIKCNFIDYIKKLNLPNLDKIHAEEFKDKMINISMMNGKKLAHIVKLGSLSENNKNTEIKSIEELNQLLIDYRYNNTKLGSYYKANIIISLRHCLYKHENLLRISFKPYLKDMEIKYNKARTVSNFDTNDNIVMIDNTLIL